MYFRIFYTVLLICFSLCAHADKPKSDAIFFKQFQDVFERVNNDYVQDPEKQKMTDAAINGMLTSLDPHSGYFTDEDLDDFRNQTDGEFGGIGVEVMCDNNVIKVVSPIDELPAYKAGIKAGDYIVGVNDDLVVNLGCNKAVKTMRGEPGSKVKLLIVSNDETKPKEVELIREIVKINPVKSHMEDGNIAYIRIVTFNKNTRGDLEKAFKTLATDAGVDGIKGVILDLRNNPGGLLDQAVAVTEYFLDFGVVVTTKGRNDSNSTILTANKFSAKAPKVPLVTIINGGSASASEIVAGALQDHKRSLIIGTKSFGKGSVQTFIQINNRAAVKLTTAKYYTPNGRSIQAEGIDPDIVIEPVAVQYNDDQKEENKRFSEASLRNYIKNDSEKAALKDKKIDDSKTKLKDKKDEDNKSGGHTKLPDLYKKDYQFARAYDLIRGLVLTRNVKECQ